MFFKSNEQKNFEKTNFLLAFCQSLTKKAVSGSESGSASQWYGSPDPDPYQNVTVIQH
jgi:hypothetical protein